MSLSGGMPASRAAVAVTLAAIGLLVGAGCSSSGDDDGGAGSEPAVTEPSTGLAADGVAGVVPDLEGKVDRVIAMIPPDAGARPPMYMLADGDALVGSRHALQAPLGDGRFADLWLWRVRSTQANGDLLDCRVVERDDESGTSSSCAAVADAALAPNPPHLMQGATSDESWAMIDLVGPVDMTHFIVTVGDERIGVIPIEGQALVYIEGDCRRAITVAAWRGDELIREEPANFC